jgi:hypothetical protein
MSMIKGVNVAVFNRDMIKQGDFIRFRRAGDMTFRNGIVTRVSDAQIEILFSNVQNNATSFAHITAADVAVGVWEARTSTDLITINYQPGAGSGGGGA